MPSAHATHPGSVRQNNEDCLRTDDSLGIYLLADGMGGHNAGEVASALAVDTAYKALQQEIGTTPDDCLFALMANAMQSAHWEINQKARTSLECMGMGTTLVVAIVRADSAYIAHAGDSRAYHFQAQTHPHPDPPLEREGTRLRQITKDHTMGDQLLAHGVPREQIQVKQFHTLTQAVGYGAPPIPDFNTVELNQGDLLLICSDGLTDMLEDDEIEAILANNRISFDSMSGELIAAANEKGGHDNVSVILVRCDK